MLLVLQDAASGATPGVEDAGIERYAAQILAGVPSAYYRLNDLPRIPSAGSGSLRWRPPDLDSAATVQAVLPTGQVGPFGDDEDVLLVLPQTRTEPMSVAGGRNIRVIGGSIVLSGSTTFGTMLEFVDVKESIFIEGMNIDAGGIAINGISCGGSGIKAPNLFIQNTRVVGINNSHGILHRYPLDRLFIDNVTIRSNDGGLTIAPRSAIKAAFLSRINLIPTSGTPILLRLLETDGNNPNGPSALIPYPIYMDEVFVTLGVGLDPTIQWAWPSTGQTANGQNVGLHVAPDGTASWPAPMQVYGS